MDFHTSAATNVIGAAFGAPRYGYWSLRDGSRTVVTVHDADIVEHLADCVVILVENRNGARRPVWIGQTGPFGGSLMIRPDFRHWLASDGVEVHVHCLANGRTERSGLADRLVAEAGLSAPLAVAA